MAQIANGVKIISNDKRRGILAEIYRGAHPADCTNGGITAPARGLKDVVVLGLDALGYSQTEIFEPTDKTPAVVIERRVIGGNIYLSAVPCDEHGVKLPGWWMFGGNYIATSDARFPAYPVPVHDRQETPEQTRALSV